MPGGAPHIGNHPEPACAIAEYKLCGLSCIVRHRERVHLQVADRENFVIANRPYVDHVLEQRLQSGKGPRGDEYRDAMPPRQPRHATDVILVFMGYDYRGEFLRNQSEAGQSRFSDRQTKTAVEQYPRTLGLDHERIAFAAAAKRRETHQNLRI